MSDHDPDLSPETRALLTRGRRGHELSVPHRRALRRTVLAQVAAGGVGLTATTSAAAWTTLTAKIVASVVVVALVGGVVYQATARRPAVRRASTVIATRDTPAPPPAATTRALPPPASPPSQDPARAGRGLAAPSSAPPLVAATAQAPASAATTSPVSAPPPTSPVLPGVAITFSPMDPSADVATAPAHAEPPAPAPRTAASLAAEAQLLLEANHALETGDAATALRLLDDHARRFPASELEPERSADRVLAMCSLGRVADARHDAALFLAAHPAGPLAARVRSSCGR